MVSISHIESVIILSQLAITSAPIWSIFELIESIPEAVSNLHCFSACKSSALEIGLNNYSAFLSNILVVGGMSMSKF